MKHGPRAVIASRIYTPEVAAAAFRLQALASELAASGATVRVLTSRPRKADGHAPVTEGITISRAPVLRDSDGNIRGYFQYLSFDIPLFFRLLFSRADVVVAEPPPTTGAVVSIICALRRLPFVYYAADIWTDAVASMSAPKIVVKLMRKVEGSVLRRAAAVLAVSDDVADRVREFGATRIHTVGNGVDTTIFTPHDSTDEEAADRGAGGETVGGEPLAPEAPLFVYAGTMSEWQGADVFLEAFALLGDDAPNAEFHLLGHGSQHAAMKARAAEISEDRIKFHGLISANDTAHWLRRATAALVSVTPDQGYDFAKPTKLYAAAACGTPVIFAGIGAAQDLVNSANLGVSVPHSPELVASAMRRLIDEQNNGITLARRADRAQWAHDNASLNTVGKTAARTILSIVAQHPKDGIA